MRVARAYPRRQLHVVVDNYATHKHPAVRAWLKRHPRVTLHFTPTSGSWLNLVEAFFSIITRQALRRGNFPTVADLIAAIERFIDAWNDRCAPFTWTKDPDTVIAKATDPLRRKHKRRQFRNTEKPQNDCWALRGSGACPSKMGEALVPVLDELTAIQADAIRATAAAHDRDPGELAFELMHLLVAEKTPEAIDASPAICAFTTDHDDTVRILLPLKGLQ